MIPKNTASLILLSFVSILGFTACGGGSGAGSIESPAGRFVVFASSANNLDATSVNDSQLDVFLRDRQNNTTTLISVDENGDDVTTVGGGSESPAISADGRRVAFASVDPLIASDTNNESDVYVRHLQTGFTERVSIATDGSAPGGTAGSVVISATGRFVVFTTSIVSFAPGEDTNNAGDVYLRDLQTDTTELISVDSNGDDGGDGGSHPAVSADGRYVAFDTRSDLTSTGDDPEPAPPAGEDVYLRDRQSDTTAIVSVNTSAQPGNGNSTNPSISADGRYVAFQSLATDLVPGIPDNNGVEDVFVRDLQTGTTELISINADGDETGNDPSGDSSTDPAISPDGRYVAFQSLANNLVDGIGDNGASHIYVRDRNTDITKIVTLDTGGDVADGGSFSPVFSSDGRFIVFHSGADDLDGQADNGETDVFVYDMQTDTIERISVATDGTNANNDSFAGDIN